LSTLAPLATLLAQAAPSPLAGPNSMFILVAIFFGIFYFMIIRPQRKQEAAIKKFIDGLQKGDEVVTNGGIIGKVDKVQDNLIVLEVSSNTRLRILKAQIAGPYAPAPAAEAADKSDKSDKSEKNDKADSSEKDKK